VEFRILGPLEVLEGGRPLPVVGEKQRALLAVLLLHANEVVSTDRLLDELWGRRPPAAGSTALRVRVSQLRKALGKHDVLSTRAPGYALRVDRDELDLHQFERLVEEAEGAQPALAAAKLHEALSLWRGEPLADFAYAPFAQAAIGRLEELRVVALEKRIEADLNMGRHADLAGELRDLVREHPLRERLRGQLMLALYRSGRQAEALEAYQAARRTLVDELGIDPSPRLQELERSILRQDPALELKSTARAARSILVAAHQDHGFDALLVLAEPLARRPVRDVILAQIVARDQFAEANHALAARRDDLRQRGIAARLAVFTSAAPGRDIVRLASEQDVDLVLLGGALTPDVEVVFAGAPCDVALLERDVPPALGPDRPILVPFGGADHDWAAVELATWIAQAQEAPLHLAGSSGDGKRGDASRLLASVSLIVQRIAGIDTAPVLVERQGLVRAAEGAGLIVFGLPARWPENGLGEVRTALAREAEAPTLLVRKGLRPGGLAPEGSRTRFTWSLATTRR
jgi:DNA-binding SARP family transcriptional activator